jgi:type IV pilus assembly protein PilW
MILSNTKGFSLIELMVALALSAILLLGMFQIFSSNQQAFSLQNGVARMQENGRIAMEIMTKNMRSVGFMGCATGQFSANFTNHIKVSEYTGAAVQTALTNFDGDNALIPFNNIAGTDLAGYGVTIGTGAGEAVAGSDAVFIQTVEPCQGLAIEGADTDANTLAVENVASCGINANSLLLVSDCSTAEAFGVTSISAATNVIELDGTNNTQTALDHFYSDGAFVYLLNFSLLYLGNNANGDTGLYLRTLQDPTGNTRPSFVSYEMAQGIEQFTILYGEDTTADGSVNTYVDGDGVTATNSVLSVQTQIDVRGDDNQAINPTNLLTSYATTNAIRNRLN